jgi:phenylacetate-CoA ligase
MDELKVLCEPASSATDSAALQRRIERALHEAIGLSMVVQVLAPGAVPRSEGKAVRVVDKRSL